MKILWIQRYPSDKSRAIVVPDDKAQQYLHEKLDDYRYTTGRAWLETVEQKGEPK
jgi:hypothetical protein